MIRSMTAYARREIKGAGVALLGNALGKPALSGNLFPSAGAVP
jgi:hypothetical protein